ncbi:MAG: hypothetical protein AAFX87_04575 [Bacteroidota bacterium]
MKFLVKLLFALVLVACLSACAEENVLPKGEDAVLSSTGNNGQVDPGEDDEGDD